MAGWIANLQGQYRWHGSILGGNASVPASGTTTLICGALNLWSGKSRTNPTPVVGRLIVGLVMARAPTPLKFCAGDAI